MALKISNNTFLEQKYLTVDPNGVLLVQTSLTGGKKRRGFGEIDAVLFNQESNVLSLHFGKEVFSVTTKPGNDAHQKAIDAILYYVRAADQPV